MTTVGNNSTAPASFAPSSALDSRIRSLISTAQQAWTRPLADIAARPVAARNVTTGEDEVELAWSLDNDHKRLQDRRLELVLAPDIAALRRAVDAPVSGIVVDLDTLCYQPVAHTLEAANAIGSWAANEARKPVWLRVPAPRGQGAEVSCAAAAAFLGGWAASAAAESALIGFELPGLRTDDQAARWAAVIAALESTLGIAHGTVAVTIRLDNREALMHLAPVLFPLRERCGGVRLSMASVLGDLLLASAQTAGGWVPARQDALSLEYPLADAISKHFTVVCHRHGALALSGMLPALPVKDDPRAQEDILQRTADLTRQRLRNGYDGVAIAHSGLISAVEAVLADIMPTPNQLERPLDWVIDPESLLPTSDVEISEAGLRNTVGIAIQGIEAALQGRGRFALYNYIEDNISTGLCWLSLWHWAHTSEVRLAEGPEVDVALLRDVINEELDIIRLERDERQAEQDCVDEAAARLLAIIEDESPPAFPPTTFRSR